MNPVLIVFGGIILVILFIWYLYRLDIKRTENFQKKAMMLGFQFYKDEKQQKVVPRVNANLFTKGHSKKKKNIMVKKVSGVDNYVFDYQFTTGYGKHSQTHSYTVAIIPYTKTMPQFVLGPEHFFNKVAQKFGSQDIDFDYNQEFSDRYVLKGKNEVLIRKFFNANAVNYLANREPGLHIESATNYLIIYRKRLGIPAIDNFIEEIKNLGRVF